MAESPEQIRHYLNVALSRIAGLEKLVADLFAYSQMELTEYRPDKGTVDLTQLVVDAADSFQISAEAKGVNVTRSTPAEPFHIYADHALLTRALDNLLSNALRHTPAEGTIEVGCRQVGDRVRISVADTGEGFPPDVLRRLANEMPAAVPFQYRSDGGLGLGLVIVRRVAELHGGAVTARNRAEGGAMVAIEIR